MADKIPEEIKKQMWQEYMRDYSDMGKEIWQRKERIKKLKEEIQKIEEEIKNLEEEGKRVGKEMIKLKNDE